jgi:hypothetical protein
MSDFSDWDKDEQGRLKVWPVQAFVTAMFNDSRGGLRLEVGAPPKPGQQQAALQVALTQDQLRQLADALTDVADRLDETSPGAGHA